ncbi:MAG: ribosome biogenesis GTPase YlqF [Lachnospiraceae bacterium]|nr:ribosome biogenesis GTPase YlqF [Lachnospiraceae bacterium]
MNYQWYPGHMTKALRQMTEDMKLIDLVIELVDARIPESSKNPDIDRLAKGKARIVLLNKADLADPKVNEQWIRHYEKSGALALGLDSRSREGFKKLDALVKEASREKRERDRRRGILNRPVRTIVVGIPNVGKSTFINSFSKKAVAKTGNKPGVTKGKQWIRLSDTLELLDTPGILWPKFENRRIGENLAITGSINDDILDREELASALLRILGEHYPDAVSSRYGIGDTKDLAPAAIMEAVARNKSLYTKGQEIDYNRTAIRLIDDFRSGRLGRISLETPPKEQT